jgi:hypothetical protein
MLNEENRKRISNVYIYTYIYYIDYWTQRGLYHLITKDISLHSEHKK